MTVRNLNVKNTKKLFFLLMQGAYTGKQCDTEKKMIISI